MTHDPFASFDPRHGPETPLAVPRLQRYRDYARQRQMTLGDLLLENRIIFLEGTPIVSRLNPFHIGADVLTQLRNDRAAEEMAIKLYNDAVRLAAEQGDNGTRDLLEDILEDEEEHIDWLEAQLDQIEQMGLQNYLLGQVS